MSADFTKVLVKDDRLDVTDNIKYAVIKGGQNMTCAQFNRISESGSQITFNIQVPSEQTIIDRRVLLETTLSLTVNSQVLDEEGVPQVITTEQLTYGSQQGLAPFPLHQLFTVMNATINNNTVSINMRDVLPVITRLMDKKEVSCYNGTTPTYVDNYTNYGDAVNCVNNSLGGYDNAIDTDIYGRGSYVPLNYATFLTSDNKTRVEQFRFKVTEPLLLSPFIYANPQSNSQGFYGIQNLNFILNIGDMTRVWRGLTASSFPSSSPCGVGKIGITSVTAGCSAYLTNGFTAPLVDGSRLLFQFLTPHPSDLMPAKNIVPYYELPRYITSKSASDVFQGNATVVASGKNVFYVSTVGKRFTSQSLQLNQIPDKLIIFLRKAGGKQNNGDADVTFPIENLSINFNNNSGLLASATPQDLYKMAKDNGSNQNWLEWSGLASQTRLFDTTSPPVLETTGFGAQAVPTVGSYITLEFGKDIQLVEDFYAPGSLGNFNLQLNITYANNLLYSISDLELIVVTLNSGVFVNERGTSATYTGILTKADVLEASEQVPFTRSEVKRMVGGGFLDMLKSAVGKILPVAKAIAPIAGPLLRSSANPYAKAAGTAMGLFGYGSEAPPGREGQTQGRGRLSKHMQ